MTIKNCTMVVPSFLKQKLLFLTATLDSIIRQKMFSSKVSHKAFDSALFFNSVFESSVKPYIDISKIHLLDKFFCPVTGMRSSYNFVIDELVAKDIVEKILSRSEVKKSILVEANPGLGLITINLINSGVPYLRVCDASSLSSLSLYQMVQKHPNNLNLQKINFNWDPASIIIPLCDDVQKQNQTVTLIGVTSSFYFIRLSIINYLKNALWRTKFEIYLVLSDDIWNSLRNFSPGFLKFLHFCAFNLLFVTENIKSYPCSAFLPVMKNNKDFHLVKISLNSNLFEQLKEEEILDYFIFITILGTRSDNLIIPTLEKWLPDCGPYLISKGISVTNKTRDFSYQESILLFNYFKKCEGYNDFKICISHAFEY